jgi:hypothetical protein
MVDLEAVVMALAARAYQSGWLDGDDGASKLIRHALEAYGAPTADEIAAKQQAERVQEIDDQIAAWERAG